MRNILIWCIDSQKSFDYKRVALGNDWVHLLEGVPDYEWVTRHWAGMEFNTLIAVPELMETIKDTDVARYLRSRCRFPFPKDSNDQTMYREMFPGRPKKETTNGDG